MAEAAAQPVFRFAPSPNGFLHLGHAYSALLNELRARESGGRLLLRIEDIDTARARPEYEAAIHEDLAWLGIAFEEPVRRQSEHFGDYEAALDRLQEMGLLFTCFCTRGEIAAAVSGRPDWPRDPDGAPIYPGTCRGLAQQEMSRRLASGLHAARRIDMADAMARTLGPVGWREFGEEREARDIRAEPAVWGDAVLARKDVPASYHIAVVVDDAIQGVTDVVRGSDLLPATSLHRLLQELLDLPAPAYHHHRLIRDESGDKLAKSAGSPSLRSLREQGVTAQDIRARLGFA